MTIGGGRFTQPCYVLGMSLVLLSVRRTFIGSYYLFYQDRDILDHEWKIDSIVQALSLRLSLLTIGNEPYVEIK